jgi:hypothetical protein
MAQITAQNQAKTRKTPEETRADRIAAVEDLKIRQELDELVKARQAKLVETKDSQQQRFEKDVAFVRAQKLARAGSPQLTPPGVEPERYQGFSGMERATMDSKAEVLRRYKGWSEREAVRFDRQIDQKLDTYERVRRSEQPAMTERQERDTADGEKAPRKLVKFEDRFPEEVKREITRSR